jgi:hypothetical protein
LFEASSLSFVLGLLRGFDGAEFLRDSLVVARTREVIVVVDPRRCDFLACTLRISGSISSFFKSWFVLVALSTIGLSVLAITP